MISGFPDLTIHTQIMSETLLHMSSLQVMMNPSVLDSPNDDCF